MKYILAFLFWCGFLKSFAQKSSIPFINTEITVDGQFNEAVWQQSPTLTNFYNYLPTDIGQSENQTEVKLFHNGEFLP